ncbi:2-oxoglutarate dehydrogenase complex dihydrolipoyllysine-residue succinyltransferase [Hirschia litorea]|uniref:Dihydrolipoyllysine-residue succinyltransferase component of 2-oxoglutarate dehydrogenase complex n=1 Tax=Hirschia litorea TaxID=1199156 RepID=A0ABW2IKZ8_9PROT
MADITVPVLGESVTEATVGTWMKAPGDAVAKDEVLVELETDKVSIEVSAAEDGVLSEIAAKEGDTVEIGALLGRIGSGSGAAPAPSAPAAAATPAAAPSGGGDSVKVVVPAMGESVTEGTLSQWLKKPGEAVEVDDPIAEIETDKVAIEVPSPVAGVLSETLIAEGTTVGIGTEIAMITAGASASAAPAAAAPTTAPAAPASSSAAVAPSVRRISAENDVNPADIPGTGRDGRATKGDALSYVAQGTKSASAAPAAVARDIGPREERVKMTRLRQTIAKRLKEAQNTAAMLTTFNDVDLTEVMAMRSKYKDLFLEKHGVKLGFMSFFTKAVVHALKEIPAVNAEIDGTDLIYKNYYDISMAVGTDKGLVTPVVRDADTMSLAQIEAEIGRLGKLARDGKLALSDLQGGTFTITNGGVYGSMMSTPILNPPQSGVLGMHRIEQRPVAIKGEVKIRPMMYLALSYDHRIVDGKEAVTFLVRVKENLEDPERLLLDL